MRPIPYNWYDMNRLITVFFITASLFNIVACANSPAVEPTATEIAQIPTNTVAPTNTVEPTEKPTDTPERTDTPTPEPTDTPEPTNTPTRTRRPTRTPSPTETDTPEPTPTDVVEEEDEPTPIPTKTPFPTDPAAPSQPSSYSSNSSNKIGIGTVSGLPDGERVIIEGSVVFTESFSRGFKFTVGDDTGRVIVLLWDTTYDTLPGRNTLNIGSNVTVTGKVDRYEGELQVTPYEAANVVINSPAYAWGQLTAVDQLRPKLNQRVMVEGAVNRSSSNEYGTKLFVNDGTGEIEVFIWNNIFQRMPNQGALKTAGTNVRVVGTVDEYRGQLQILPALPYDVVIP